MNLPIIKPDNTLRDAFKEMGEMNAGMVQIVFGNDDDMPLCALILIRGDDTGRYIEAIKQVESELEEESNEG